MASEPQAVKPDVIVTTVLDLLETGGYESVQLREVARRAHVSMTTIYRRYNTRDELILAATERWMSVNGHAPIDSAPPGESMYDGLMRIFRHLFEPWEKSPRMLETYHRASMGEAGARLRAQGSREIVPAARTVLAGADPQYAKDVEVILTNMAYAVVGRFADGEIGITEILPILERAVYRLTADDSKHGAKAVTSRRRRGRAR